MTNEEMRIVTNIMKDLVNYKISIIDAVNKVIKMVK